jgi:hypothetical protein
VRGAEPAAVCATAGRWARSRGGEMEGGRRARVSSTSLVPSSFRSACLCAAASVPLFGFADWAGRRRRSRCPSRSPPSVGDGALVCRAQIVRLLPPPSPCLRRRSAATTPSRGKKQRTNAPPRKRHTGKLARAPQPQAHCSGVRALGRRRKAAAAAAVDQHARNTERQSSFRTLRWRWSGVCLCVAAGWLLAPLLSRPSHRRTAMQACIRMHSNRRGGGDGHARSRGVDTCASCDFAS